MMETADTRDCDQVRKLPRLARNRAHRRCVFLKRIVDSIHVIVRDVFSDQTAQMNLIEEDHVIEKVPSAAPDPAFRNSVLPGAGGACARRF